MVKGIGLMVLATTPVMLEDYLLTNRKDAKYTKEEKKEKDR